VGLYVVERDIRDVPAESLRLWQRDVAMVCLQLRSQGKRIRYISSSLVPADEKSLDLFGAESAEVIQEAHETARVAYARIVEILDFTPSFIPGGLSRSRHSRQWSGGALTTCKQKGAGEAMSEQAAPELARWLEDGQRLFRVCLETLEGSARLQARSQTLERENGMLREEVARLRHRVDVLETERAEMIAAVNDLAGHVTQAVDQILQRSEDGETAK
jgi:hypothetical protein